jgi:hypothetical protein
MKIFIEQMRMGAKVFTCSQHLKIIFFKHFVFFKYFSRHFTWITLLCEFDVLNRPHVW